MSFSYAWASVSNSAVKHYELLMYSRDYYRTFCNADHAGYTQPIYS
jgi:hypothetical protein